MKTIISASTLEKEIKSKLSKDNKTSFIAEILAKRAKDKKISEVYFDRGRFKYHGKVKAFADALRKKWNEILMEKTDFKEKLVAINRITKVVKGGRRFGFAALVVVGNLKGNVGIGQGKSKQVPDAIKKATENAKRNQVKIPLKEGRTLHHDVTGKNGSGKVFKVCASRYRNYCWRSY